MDRINNNIRNFTINYDFHYYKLRIHDNLGNIGIVTKIIALLGINTNEDTPHTSIIQYIAYSPLHM